MSLEKQLLEAVKKGNIKEVRSLLEGGANVNANIDHYAPLHCAASSGHIEVIELLLQHGANIEITNWFDGTPLHSAAIDDANIEVVQLLLDHRANIDARDNGGKTPLYNTVERQSKKIAALLLQRGADIDAIDNDGQTPLRYAAERESVGIAKFFFENGAKVDTQNNLDYLALYVAAALGNKEKIKSLLDQPEVSIDVRTFKECTLLHLAAQNEDVEVAEFLLKNRAEVDAIDMSTDTPLFYAARGNNIKVAALLLEHGADVNYHGSFKYTPLHYAAENGNEEMAALLLQYRADINARDDFHITPLHSTISEKNTKMVDFLINKGADVNAEDNRGDSILHFAALYICTPQIVLRLLDQGVKINAKNHDGETPLSYVASNGHYESKDGKGTLFTLLLRGADVSAKDRQKINEKSEFKSCLTAFAEIKAMPHLGRLIEANIKKEGAKAIASYINNEAEGQKLSEEFKTIKEKYGSDKQLSFIPQYLSNFINHITPANEKKNCAENAVQNFLTLCKLPNSSEIVEKIASHLDVLDGISLALNNELTNTCQNPNTALAASQIEPLAEHQHMER